MHIAVDGDEYDLLREDDLAKLSHILGTSERASTLIHHMQMVYRANHGGKPMGKYLQEFVIHASPR